MWYSVKSTFTYEVKTGGQMLSWARIALVLTAVSQMMAHE